MWFQMHIHKSNQILANSTQNKYYWHKNTPIKLVMNDKRWLKRHTCKHMIQTIWQLILWRGARQLNTLALIWTRGEFYVCDMDLELASYESHEALFLDLSIQLENNWEQHTKTLRYAYILFIHHSDHSLSNDIKWPWKFNQRLCWLFLQNWFRCSHVSELSNRHSWKALRVIQVKKSPKVTGTFVCWMSIASCNSASHFIMNSFM